MLYVTKIYQYKRLFSFVYINLIIKAKQNYRVHTEYFSNKRIGTG